MPAPEVLQGTASEPDATSACGPGPALPFFAEFSPRPAEGQAPWAVLWVCPCGFLVEDVHCPWAHTRPRHGDHRGLEARATRVVSVLPAVGSFQNVSAEGRLPGVSSKGYFGRRTPEAARPLAMGERMLQLSRVSRGWVTDLVPPRMWDVKGARDSSQGRKGEERQDSPSCWKGLWPEWMMSWVVSSQPGRALGTLRESHQHVTGH